MTISILLGATVILLCILAEKFSGQFGMPALILFMFVGILFGSDGIIKIPFSNYTLAEEICSIALLFIMFYGGFNTKWKAAKNSAGKALLLSTVGVLITAGITAVLCMFLLKFSLLESLLIGAVLSSTDAASVFAILRKQKLNLKDGTASLLELESASNDPFAYLLTVVIVSLLKAEKSVNIPLQVFMQLSVGVVAAIIFAWIAVYLLLKTKIIAEGLDTIFLIAIMLMCYAFTELCGGNIYLSVYLLGLIIGNSKIKNKNIIIPFLDGVTSLAQILIFFLLGLLTFPHKMISVIPIAIAIALFVTVIARPIAVFLLLRPFKSSIQQCLLISWSGLRGAASSVFAIFVLVSGVTLHYDLFHIVFLVSLFSVAIQGTFLPLVAQKLAMIDKDSDVRKTFNDYQEESAITLMRMFIPKGHSWVNKQIKDVNLPAGSLAIMIKRNHNTIITKGDTKILAGDIIILNVPAYEPKEDEALEEIHIDKSHNWRNKPIANLNLPQDMLIALIIRGDENLIPDGNTVIQENDVVVTYH
ncbi:potassium/proton antiporter [Ligilactobacillus sp. WILCCON 0076]|uniref:Potassium/proton antiporter n=1 Tax=Ligilactobacillus ubinensis TaxID=2876789 RepID=A0A9X2JN23_9LACO|nr:potassium/proton antiporter [Ligilactobacillus ubinensis]MCP0887311.1 potassium/proton antiporter [Ligilactobacillus ubinensis]